MTAIAEPQLTSRVRDFVSTDRKMLIGGEWVDAASGKTFTTYDPATTAPITDVAYGDASDVDRAVRAARKAFDDGHWARMKPNERERLLWRVGDILSERAEEFGQLEALDNGKSAGIAAAVDTQWSADIFRYNAGLATKIFGSTVNAASRLTSAARPGSVLVDAGVHAALTADTDGGPEEDPDGDADPTWRWRRVRRVSAKGFANLEAWRVRERGETEMPGRC